MPEARSSAGTPLPIPAAHQITPGQRRALQEQFDAARRALLQDPPQPAEATRLLLDCLVRDPSNLLVAQAFLANQRQRFPRPRPWAGLWASTRCWLAVARQSWESVLRHGTHALAANPNHPPLLGVLAQACAAFGYEEVEQAYLRHAIELSPDDPRWIRQWALSLTRTGHFDTALDAWWRLLRLRPADPEALAAAEALTLHVHRPDPDNRLEDLDPTDVAGHLRLADEARQRDDFHGARIILHRALEATPMEIGLQEALEDLALQEAQQRVTLARNRLAVEADASDSELLARMVQTLRRTRLDVFHARSQRYPQEPRWQFELAQVLKELQRYREAEPLFAGVVDEADLAGMALLGRAECLQGQQRYDEALAAYRELPDRLPPDDQEARQLAAYRHGVLATALDLPDEARRVWEQLLTATGEYRDVADRLDKLPPIGDKEGLP